MRVALIAPPWLPVPPATYGGTEAVVDRLARGLEAAGLEVVLVTVGDSTCPTERRVVVLPRSRPGDMGLSSVEVPYVLEAYDAARATGADVIHDHTVAGVACAARPGDAVAVTNHGPFDPPARVLFGRAAQRASVVAISHAHAAAADPGTVEAVIHHGIDVDDVPVGRGDGGYLAFLGRVSPSKGLREAIGVARRAGMPLRIAAKCREAGERAYFDDVIRPLLGSDAEYLGEIGAAEKFELLGSAAALVNPIRWPEPFGLVMIEALATGTPVLALANGSAPEIVDHGVTGVVALTPDMLADAVPTIGRLSRAACRASVATRFSTDRMVADHVELYRRVLADRRLGPDALRPTGPRPLVAP